MTDAKQQHSPQKAMWLSLVLGLGQLYNGQKAKGLILLGIFALEILEIVTFGIPAIQGLITLGSTPVVDHSLFMLIKGSMQLIAFVIMAIIHVAAMRDAYHTAKLIRAGIEVPLSLIHI